MDESGRSRHQFRKQFPSHRVVLTHSTILQISDLVGFTTAIAPSALVSPSNVANQTKRSSDVPRLHLLALYSYILQRAKTFVNEFHVLRGGSCPPGASGSGTGPTARGAKPYRPAIALTTAPATLYSFSSAHVGWTQRYYASYTHAQHSTNNISRSVGPT